MTVPQHYSWSATTSLDEFIGPPSSPLEIAIGRFNEDGTMIRPLLVAPVELARMWGLEVHVTGRTDAGQIAVTRFEAVAMAWRDVEEIAAFVQSWGAECVDDVNLPRWHGRGLTSRVLLELIPGFVHLMNPRIVEQRKALR